MKVCEIFKGIQGEGRYMGQPFVFIRLAGCNLRCDACDTKFAWNPSSSFELTPKELVEKVISVWEKSNLSYLRILFTGGEPLLQLDEILEFEEELSKRDVFYELHLETNGTICKRKALVIFDHITVSPKPKYTKDEHIKFWSQYSGVDFKLVINPLEFSDVPPAWVSASKAVKRLLDFGISRDRIWLMPFGQTRSELDKAAERVYDFALSLGVNYSDRLHIRVGRR